MATETITDAGSQLIFREERAGRYVTLGVNPDGYVEHAARNLSAEQAEQSVTALEASGWRHIQSIPEVF